MKKKVTAPLTYDPGKGRPKEHLAYLNYQEMQALKRINGNNQERGPKGLPSFPPADAIGSSSKASSSKSTGARGPTGPKGEARTSPAGGKAGSVSRSVGAGKASNAGASRSSSEAKGATGAKTSAAKGTGARGPTGPKGEARATPARAQAAKPSTGGGVRSLNVGPMGTRVDVKTGGTKIKGAIKNVAQAAPAPRAPTRTIGPGGPFGPQGYTGKYNPATGQYDAGSAQMVNRVGKTDYGTVLPSGTSGMWGGPPQTVNRAGKTDLEQSVNRAGKADFSPTRISGTATAWGGPTVDVPNRAGKSDLPARTPSIGERLSDYASSAYDAVAGGIRSIGASLPPNVFTPPSSSTFTDKIGPRLAYRTPIGPQLPAQQAIGPNTTTVQRGTFDLRSIIPSLSSTSGTSTEWGGPTVDVPTRDLRTDIPGAVAQNMAADEIRELMRRDAEAFAEPARPSAPFSWEGVRPYDIRVTAPPASGIDLRAPAKTRGLNVQPMGAAAIPEENILSVEDMPEETPLGLTGKAARKAAKKAGIPASVYNQPGFTDDVDQLGIGVTAPDTFSATDMAKLHARAYGGAYLTPAERRQAAVTKGILRGGQAVLNMAMPGAGTLAKGVGKLADAESVESFLGRPSYEQGYLRDLARAENIRYGRDPLGRESYTTADGRVVSSPVTGGIGSGRSSNERETPGGIGNLPTATPTTPSTETTSTSGTRPYIYYQWDLGMNVPSPSDPNYTQYQKYLSDRAARRAALGMT